MQEHRESRGRPAGSPAPACSRASRRRRPSRDRRPGGRAARRAPSRRPGRSSRHGVSARHATSARHPRASRAAPSQRPGLRAAAARTSAPRGTRRSGCCARRARDTPARPPRAPWGRCRTPRGKGQSQTLSLLHRGEVVAAHAACRAGAPARAPAASTAPGPSATIGRGVPGDLADVADELAQRVDLRPAQRIALADRRVVGERVRRSSRATSPT